MAYIRVKKKNGSVELWNTQNILKASNKAAERVNEEFNADLLLKKVSDRVAELPKHIYNGDECIIVDTATLHQIVIDALKEVNPKVAQSYQEFRDYKMNYAREFSKIKGLADDVLLLGDKENANFESSLVSTKGSLIRGYVTKSLYQSFYLSNIEKEFIKRGDIYIHDLRDMIFGSINCCLFDMATVLKGGFEMSNISYSEPNSALAALQVIGDVTLVASAQQFGGFTIPEIDKTLLPYCKKTLERAKRDYRNLVDTDDIVGEEAYANKVLKRELEQGFQALELKLNTIPSSRGDFAFTTLTFGQWDKDTVPEEDVKIIYMIDSTILKTRMKGHGGKQVVFPKLVFLYDHELIQQNEFAQKLFDLAVECSSKCMYPDYLSLTGEPYKNKVAGLYLSTGAITSPMGCRAFLTPWRDPKTNKYVTVGRFNIGAVSLNLPVIMAVAKEQAKHGAADWHKVFWWVLEDRLEAIRKFFLKRYDYLKTVKASTNPMGFMQGGFYRGHLKADDTIEPLLEYSTASFGITALNEATILYSGHTIAEDNSFAKKVLEFIKDKIEDYKQKDKVLYAIYGTPAESLCGTQAKQYYELTHDNQFGEYFSNSFHCHVKEDIHPFEKQDREYDTFHLCGGGHIQYVRIYNPENITALKIIIQRGMDMGFYQGVNFDEAYCEDCHKHSTNVTNKCPYCDSTNLTVISRVCGYLGYSNINGQTRMNDAKMAELKDRKSM